MALLLWGVGRVGLFFSLLRAGAQQTKLTKDGLHLSFGSPEVEFLTAQRLKDLTTRVDLQGKVDNTMNSSGGLIIPTFSSSTAGTLAGQNMYRFKFKVLLIFFSCFAETQVPFSRQTTERLGLYGFALEDFLK